MERKWLTMSSIYFALIEEAKTDRLGNHFNFGLIVGKYKIQIPA